MESQKQLQFPNILKTTCNMSLIKSNQKKSKQVSPEKKAESPVQPKKFNIIITPQKAVEFDAWSVNQPYGIMKQLEGFFASCPREEVK